MNAKEISLAEGRLHWGIFCVPLLSVLCVFVVTLPLLILLHVMSNTLIQVNPQSAEFPTRIFYVLLLLPEFLIGLPLLLAAWAAYAKSKITLTNRRLMFRTGLLARVAGELPLENVEAIILVEPILGRILGYGTVVATSVGGMHFPLRCLASAGSFHAALQKAVVEAKSPGGPKPPGPNDDSRYMPKS